MNVRLKRTPGLYLVGFMGSGKSTTARLLASQLGWLNTDLDKRITEATHLTIPDIFARMGEPEACFCR